LPGLIDQPACRRVGDQVGIAIRDAGGGQEDEAILAPGLSDCDLDVFDPPPWATDDTMFGKEGQGVYMGPVYGFAKIHGSWVIGRR
jgi:hypothetical protein